jgi:y4mF family transcriptional regulator
MSTSTPPATVSAIDLARAAARSSQSGSHAAPAAEATDRRRGPAARSSYVLFLDSNALTALDPLRDAGDALQPAVKLSDLKKRSALAQLARDMDTPPRTGQPQGSYAKQTVLRVSDAATGDDAVIDSAFTLGGMIRNAREMRGLSQQKLADKANVGRRLVSELENGKATLEFEKVLKVAAAAGVRLTARSSP